MSYGMMGMSMGMMGGMGMMGMRGMGMMGMSGMGMMGGGQTKKEPEPEPEPVELREYQVQHALQFVRQPEVQAQDIEEVKAYLANRMGLNEDETVAVLQRSGLDPNAYVGMPPPEEDPDIRELPATMEAADDELYMNRRSRLEGRAGSGGTGSRLAGQAAALAGLPATAAYSAVATMLGGALADQAGVGGKANMAQAQAAQHAAYSATHLLSQQALQAEAAGLRVPPIVLLNQSGLPVGGGGGGVARGASPWSQRRLLLTAACIALAYFGVKAGWMAALRPALIDRLRRVAAFCGLDVRAKPPSFSSHSCSTAELLRRVRSNRRRLSRRRSVRGAR